MSGATVAFLQAAASQDPFTALPEYGAIGIVATFALLGLIWTVKQYRSSNERFIHYLEEHSAKNAEERQQYKEVMTTMVKTLERMEQRLEDTLREFQTRKST